MALGTVETIDAADPSVGTVAEAESGKTYPYNDKDFATKGLQVGDPVTYDIDYTVDNPIATNLQKYVPTTTEITTPVAGPYNVANGETLKVKGGGKITGAITVNSANLIVEDGGTVEGDVSVTNQGNVVARKGGVIKGAINVNHGSALKVVNKGVIKGAINVNNANRLIIGNDNGGGIVTGAITIERVRRVIITATSTINCA
ncbi:MAG: hypothetical protein J0L69_11450 [Bacteroidetes bacterium]|nr:hypothetical protein [Bacteroidota bacterium]